MENNKWRFPASGFGDVKGTSTGDSETFKKSPFKAFAREILQNSIDARDSDEYPTKVEFSEFKIKTKHIPNIEGYKKAVNLCIDYWKDSHPEYVDEYKLILKKLEDDEIECLRISDFNTKGLVGVTSKDAKDNSFLALTKGSGVSEKSSNVAGGSKGVGKNAAFLLSELNLVFYSTKNIKNEKGHIGVAKLITGYCQDDINNPHRDYTQGTGYFCSDDYNSPILEVLNLDSEYSNRENENGTDIYIIGFKKYDEWKEEIINSILDSFMATIVRGDLEIEFNKNIINKETVKNIIYSDIIEEKNKANIISQYNLLTDGNRVRVFDIDTDYGTATLYVLPYNDEEEHLATHECVMIRHPLMKIRTYPLSQNFNASAMCIIKNDSLGKILRSIENPQHIDWETKRLDSGIRKSVENAIKSMRDQISEYVMQCLKMGDENPLDPNGASEWLSEDDIGGNSGKKELKKGRNKTTVTSIKPNSTSEKNANKAKEDGMGLEPDIGSVADEGTDTLHPQGENEKSGGTSHPGDNSGGGNNDGDSVIFKRAKLAGIRPKVICTNKREGKLRIVFSSPINYKNCYLNLALLDDTNAKTNIEIIRMKFKGKDVKSDDSIEYGPFKVEANERVVLEVWSNVKGYFASEVKIICK